MSVITFEDYTVDLKRAEIKVAQDIKKRMLEHCIGKKKQVTAGAMIKSYARYKDMPCKLDDAKIRKMISWIRQSGELICATSRGYFVAETREEFETYMHSRRQRVNNETWTYNIMMKQTHKIEALK